MRNTVGVHSQPCWTLEPGILAPFLPAVWIFPQTWVVQAGKTHTVRLLRQFSVPAAGRGRSILIFLVQEGRMREAGLKG